MAKRDVEFSIGADNDELKRDLKESEKIVDKSADKIQDDLDSIDADKAAKDVEKIGDEAEDAAKDVDKIGDAADGLDFDQVVGKVTDVVTAISSAITAAIDLNKEIKEIAKGVSGVQFQGQMAEFIQDRLDEGAEQRREDVLAGRPQAQMNRRQQMDLNIAGIEGQIRNERERLSFLNDQLDAWIKDLGPFANAALFLNKQAGMLDEQGRQRQIGQSEDRLTELTNKLLEQQGERAELVQAMRASKKDVSEAFKQREAMIKAINNVNSGTMTQ